MENKEFDEPFIEKPKHRGLKLFIAIILIAAISFGGYYYYTNYYNNSNKKVKTIFTQIENKLDSRLNNPFFTNNALNLNGLIKIGIDGTLDEQNNNSLKKLFDVINNLQIQVNGKIDSNNKISNIDISSKYKDNNLLSGKIYTENNNVYISSKDLIDKTILLGNLNEYMDNTQTNVDANDIKTIIECLSKAIGDVFETKEITKVDDNIKVDSNSYNVNKYTITLKDTEINDAIVKVINVLMNDEAFAKAIKKIDGEADIKNLPPEILDEIKKQKFEGTYRLNFYTKKNSLNEELIRVQQVIDINQNKNEFNIDFVNSDTAIFAFNQDEVNLSIKLVLNESICNIDINTNLDKLKVNLSMNFNYEKTSGVAKENVSNSIKINELTEADEEYVTKKLQENTNLTNFINDLQEPLTTIMGGLMGGNDEF